MVDQKIVLSKIAHIKSNIDHIKGKQKASYDEFKSDLDTQVIIIHNLQTAIQSCIDIASHIISDEGWQIPDSLSNLFDILLEHKVIDAKINKVMKSMVGFRNIIVHEYQAVDLKKVYSITKENLGDFGKFLKQITVSLNL